MVSMNGPLNKKVLTSDAYDVGTAVVSIWRSTPGR